MKQEIQPDGAPLVAAADAATLEELERSRRQYQDLVNTIDGIVWEAEVATLRFTFVSERVERLLGYTSERWLSEPSFWQNHLHPDDREWVMQFCAVATAEKRDHDFEYRMIAADGRTVWFRDIVTVVVENDVAVTLRGVMVDVTERKAIDQELRRREDVLEAVRFAADCFLDPSASWEDCIDQVLERLGRATDVSRVYIFENYTGPDGGVWGTNTHEWVNAGIPSMIERPQLRAFSDRGVGIRRWAEIFRRGETMHGHVRDLPHEERVELEAEGTLSYVLVPIFVDGAWWGWIGFDDCAQERGFSAIERDALKAAADTLGAAIGRMHADEELHESQRSHRTLLSNLPGMAYRSVPGTPWRIDFVSEGALDLTGFPPAALAGNERFSFVDLIRPDDRPVLRREIEAAIAERLPYYLTYRITTASGEEKWVMEQGRAVHDSAGDAIALEGIITDVTDRVQARQLLEQRVEERTRELGTLLEIARNVAATLELEPLLGLILDEVRAAVEYHGAGILILHDGVLVQAAGRGPSPERIEEGISVTLADAAMIREMLERGEPRVIGDVWGDDRLALDYRRAVTEDWLRDRPYVRSWAGVPLQVRNRTLGLMVITYADPNHFTERHVALLTAVAAQAAVAIDNARLYEEARGMAALEERQRLARELHDSVSQALFGIGLGARTARTLIDQDPAKAVAPLDYVLSLAEAGLAEMRALIFELRPEALEQEGLVAALEKQAAALRARYGIAVEVTLPGVVDAPQPVQEAIYRIAQEALHNVVKHARATAVEVRLEQGDSEIDLRIADDGVGFDAGGSFPGHLGLRSMAERAERLGGTIRIASASGEGSSIEVLIPFSEHAEP